MLPELVCHHERQHERTHRLEQPRPANGQADRGHHNTREDVCVRCNTWAELGVALFVASEAGAALVSAAAPCWWSPRLLVRTVGGQMAGSPSLYSEYAMSSPPRSVGHSPTRTSRLRSNIIKLSCYLNGEADRSRATVVRLPEECDTLGEVIPKIHKRMGMDKRIAFAAELFLPDGT